MKWATAAQHNGMSKILNNEFMIIDFPRAVFDSRMTFCVSFFHFFRFFLVSTKGSVDPAVEERVASDKVVSSVPFSKF